MPARSQLGAATAMLGCCSMAAAAWAALSPAAGVLVGGERGSPPPWSLDEATENFFIRHANREASPFYRGANSL